MKPPIWTFFDGNCLQRKRIFLSVYTLVDVCPTLLSVPPLYHNIYVVSWEIWQVDKCSPNVWIEDWRGPSFYVNTLLLNMNTICQDQHAQLSSSCHNVSKIISKTTYSWFPLLSALDCNNLGGKGVRPTTTDGNLWCCP